MKFTSSGCVNDREEGLRPSGKELSAKGKAQKQATLRAVPSSSPFALHASPLAFSAFPQ
jgi:hypothetical protein